MNAGASGGSVEEPVFLRIERWRILIPGAVVFSAAIFGCYRVLATQGDPFEIAIGIATPFATALVGAHYLWFYYLSVGDTSLVHLNYFGLAHKTIPLAGLSRVSVSVFRGWLFNSPHLRFDWPEGEIELIASVYDKRPIKRAIAKLHHAGVPMDRALLEADWLRA